MIFDMKILLILKCANDIVLMFLKQEHHLLAIYSTNFKDAMGLEGKSGRVQMKHD